MSWFRFTAATGTSVYLHIYDLIGDWIDDLVGWGDGTTTAKSFVDELAALDESVKTIRVHINSPGGDVFGGVTIANALRDQRMSKNRRVETIVDGLAASAASIVAMAGSPIRMADNALMMIHNPWTVAVGNADEMRANADRLDTVRDTLVSTYQWHSEMAGDDIAALMDAETWMTAAEAVANGFADEVVEGLRAAASISPRTLGTIAVPAEHAATVATFLADPEAAPAAPAPETGSGPVAAGAPLAPKAVPGSPVAPASRRRAPAPVSAADATAILTLCTSAGLEIGFAQALLGKRVSLEEARARVAAATEARDREEARVREIRGFCEVAGLESFAAGFVAGSMTIDAVREHVAEIVKVIDRAAADAGVPPDDQARIGGKRINFMGLLTERHRAALKGGH